MIAARIPKVVQPGVSPRGMRSSPLLHLVIGLVLCVGCGGGRPRGTHEGGNAWTRRETSPSHAKDGETPSLARESPREAAAEAGPAPSDLIPTELAVRMEPRIFFVTDSTEMVGQGSPILDAVAMTLSTNPEIERVAVIGHSDIRPPHIHALARARAERVVQALVERGVAPERLEVYEAGASHPLARGTGEAALARNRRVELSVLRMGGVELRRWDARRQRVVDVRADAPR